MEKFRVIDEKTAEVVALIIQATENARKQPIYINFLTAWEKHLAHGGVNQVEGALRAYSPSEVTDALTTASERLPSAQSVNEILASPKLDLVTSYGARGLIKELNVSDALNAAASNLSKCQRCRPKK